jgi:hypothetical protein
MITCIPKEYVDDVLKIVADSDSVSRNKKLTELFKNNQTAQDINLLYEKTLLLKNQEKALSRFVDDITGISAEKKARLKENIQKNNARRKEIMSKAELNAIAKDVYDRKYKLDIEPKDVAEIASLKNKADELKAKAEATGKERSPDSKEWLDYGRATVRFTKKIEDTVMEENKIPTFLGTLGYRAKQSKDRIASQEGLYDKFLETASIGGEIATTGLAKAIQATADASFIFRQGYKLMPRNFKIWKKSVGEGLESFKNITNKQKQELIFDEFKARLVASKYYEEALDSGLAIGIAEDYYPTNLAEKIPFFGNAAKVSDIGFTTFSQGARMGLFEKTVDNFKKRGIDLNKETLSKIAERANSVSGRGKWSQLESIGDILNKIFFSQGYIKSNLDVFSKPLMERNPALRKEYQKDTAALLLTIFGAMAAADQFTDVEWDSRSSKFGKAKIPGSKDTWVDITGGIGSYITLGTRGGLATLNLALDDKNKIPEIKSATSGKFTLLGDPSTYKPNTFEDVFFDFFKNKAAPLPSQLMQVYRGRDFSGEKPTWGSIGFNMSTPITAQNYLEILDEEDSMTAFISLISDGLGSAATNYSQYKK